MPQLVEALRDELPPRFFCHYSKELEPVFTSSYNITSLGTHHKMDFHGFRDDFLLRGLHECVQLTTRDASSLRKLYQIAYPGNYFNSYMLVTGKYYGIKKGEKILSVAGIHVYSRTYRIAVLGDITTHPLMRNQGLDTQCTRARIGPGGSLTISVNVTDIIGTPIDEATATTPLGYLEIIYFLRQQGNGHYLVTRETPIIAPGIYDITVTVQKEGYHLSRTSTKLTISAID